MVHCFRFIFMIICLKITMGRIIADIESFQRRVKVSFAGYDVCCSTHIYKVLIFFETGRSSFLVLQRSCKFLKFFVPNCGRIKCTMVNLTIFLKMKEGVFLGHSVIIVKWYWRFSSQKISIWQLHPTYN